VSPSRLPLPNLRREKNHCIYRRRRRAGKKKEARVRNAHNKVRRKKEKIKRRNGNRKNYATGDREKNTKKKINETFIYQTGP